MSILRSPCSVAKEMAQWVRAAALAEDPGSFPTIHIKVHNHSRSNLMPTFGLLRQCMYIVHTCIHAGKMLTRIKANLYKNIKNTHLIL